jgi:hypothetical protein
MQGDVEYLALIVDLREALLDRAEAVVANALIAQRGHKISAAKYRLEYSSQGRGFSKHPKPMKPFWNDLEEPTRRILQNQIWNHIEREYHPFTPIKKLPEPRPPPPKLGLYRKEELTSGKTS